MKAVDKFEYRAVTVLDVRDVVDRQLLQSHRRSGADDPHPRAHDRDDQQLIRTSRQLVQELGREPTPRRSRPRWRCRSTRSEKLRSPRSRFHWKHDRRGRRQPPGRFHREQAGRVNPWNRSSSLSLREQTNKVLNSLTPREEKVLACASACPTGCEHTLEESAGLRASPASGIRQIEAKALRKLRHPSRSKKLRSFSNPEHHGERGP